MTALVFLLSLMLSPFFGLVYAVGKEITAEPRCEQVVARGAPAQPLPPGLCNKLS